MSLQLDPSAWPGTPPRRSRFTGGWGGAFKDFWSDFGPRLTQSGRVIHALMLRDAQTRFGRRTAGYAWAVLMPLGQALVLTLIFTLLGRQPAAGDSLAIFFLTGILPITFWRTSAVAGARAIRANRQLMSYPQVKPFHIVLARVLLEGATTMLATIILILGYWAFTGLPVTSWIDRPLSLFAALGVLFIFSWGTAVLSSQIGRVFEQWADIMSLIGRALWFTSGVFFTFSSLPGSARTALMTWNPMAHLIEWIRDAAISDFSSSYFNPWFPLAVGLICAVIGLFMEWLIRLSGMTDE